MAEETRNLLIMIFIANMQRKPQGRFRNQYKLQKKKFTSEYVI